MPSSPKGWHFFCASTGWVLDPIEANRCCERQRMGVGFLVFNVAPAESAWGTAGSGDLGVHPKDHNTGWGVSRQWGAALWDVSSHFPAFAINTSHHKPALGSSCSAHLTTHRRYLRPSPHASLLLSPLGPPALLVLWVRNRQHPPTRYLSYIPIMPAIISCKYQSCAAGGTFCCPIIIH